MGSHANSRRTLSKLIKIVGHPAGVREVLYGWTTHTSGVRSIVNVVVLRFYDSREIQSFFTSGKYWGFFV